MKHADLWIVFGLIAIALVVVSINWNLVRYPSLTYSTHALN
jgi:hypothetical protein